MCFSCICLFVLYGLVFVIFSSSWCRGLAVVCDYGTPWTFLLTVLKDSNQTIGKTIEFIFLNMNTVNSTLYSVNVISLLEYSSRDRRKTNKLFPRPCFLHAPVYSQTVFEFLPADKTSLIASPFQNIF